MFCGSKLFSLTKFNRSMYEGQNNGVYSILNDFYASHFVQGA